MSLLAAIVLSASGCSRRGTGTPAPGPGNVDLYATVLKDVRRDSIASMVVVDSLIPVREIELLLRLKAQVALGLSRVELDRFLLAQQQPVDRFQRAMLPDPHWTALSRAHIDALRAAARLAAARAPGAAGRTGEFWTKWYHTYPGSGGYVTLSPASVTRNGTMAIIHVQIACGPACGSTELRVLQRDATGVWRIANRVILSES